jgi:hypothetical protein
VSEICIEKWKWPRIPHYRHSGWILGDDEFGQWIEIRIPTPVYRQDTLVFEDSNGGLLLVPREQPWLAWFPKFGEFNLYVDIATGLTRTEHSVAVVDLDLDVVRLRTGEVQLLDEDEFLLHQLELDYPAHIIELARRQADDVRQGVTTGAMPFDGERASVWQAIIDAARSQPVGARKSGSSNKGPIYGHCPPG